MYPHERSLVETYAHRPFAIIGVNSDDDREKLKEVLQEKNLPWRSFFDGALVGGPIATQWGVNGWPTVYVLDHEGVIRGTDRSDEALDALIEELVQAAEAAPR